MTKPKTFLYLEIAESLRRRIASGELRPDDKLPPVREMARRWGCTPGTVSRAYAQLAREGLVAGHRGGGTRVMPGVLDAERPAWQWAALVNRAERFLLEALGSGHTPAQAESALSVAISRPRSLSAIPPRGDYTQRFVQNDDQFYSDVPFRRQYVLADSLEFGELARDRSGAITDQGLLFLLRLGLDAAEPRSVLGAQRVAYLGSERLGGVKCRHLALSIDGYWHEIWVAKGRQPWLLRYWKPVTCLYQNWRH